MYDPSRPSMDPHRHSGYRLETRHQIAGFCQEPRHRPSQRNDDWLWPMLIEFGDRVLRELPEESELGKCGFCMAPIESFRGRGNFCQVRIGRCGHLFHASREMIQTGTACFNRMTEANRQHRGHVACMLCRRREQCRNGRKRHRTDNLSDGEYERRNEHSPARSRTVSINSEK